MKVDIQTIKGAVRIAIGDQAVEMDGHEATKMAAAIMLRAGVKSVTCDAKGNVDYKLFPEHPFAGEWGP